MKKTTLALPLLVLVAGGTGVAVATADGPDRVAGLIGAAPEGAVDKASAPRITDVDLELRTTTTLHTDVETSDTATKVTVRHAGVTTKARRGELDREDRTRDWTVVAPSRGAKVGQRATVVVKACTGSRCSSRTYSERLELDD